MYEISDYESQILLFAKGHYDEELETAMGEISDLFEKYKINKKELFKAKEVNKYEVFIKAFARKFYKGVKELDVNAKFVSDLKTLAKKIGISFTPEIERQIHIEVSKVNPTDLKIYKELLGTHDGVEEEQDMIRARHRKRTLEVPYKMKKANSFIDLLVSKNLLSLINNVYENESDDILSNKSKLISDYLDTIKNVFGKIDFLDRKIED